MKQRLIISISLLSTLFLFGVQIINACSCGGEANPCSSFEAKGGVIFTGTVINVVDSNEKYGKPIEGNARKITIRVDEVFKGSIPSIIETSDDGVRCDNYPFKLNESYLVYANGILEKTSNIIPIGLCSGTGNIDVKEEDLKFLRMMKNGKMPSILYGRLQKAESANKFTPLPNIRVFLTQEVVIKDGKYIKPEIEGREFDVLTDINGEYQFENLESGKYMIQAEVGKNLWIPNIREVYFSNAPFCQNRSLIVFDNGTISGSIQNNDTTPAKNVELSIQPVDPNTRIWNPQTRTDDKGNFVFQGLSVGKYIISTYLQNYSLDGARTYPFERFPFSHYFYSNTLQQKEAEILNLEENGKLTEVNFLMPSLPIKVVVNG